MWGAAGSGSVCLPTSAFSYSRNTRVSWIIYQYVYVIVSIISALFLINHIFIWSVWLANQKNKKKPVRGVIVKGVIAIWTAECFIKFLQSQIFNFGSTSSNKIWSSVIGWFSYIDISKKFLLWQVRRIKTKESCTLFFTWTHFNNNNTRMFWSSNLHQARLKRLVITASSSDGRASFGCSVGCFSP